MFPATWVILRVPWAIFSSATNPQRDGKVTIFQLDTVLQCPTAFFFLFPVEVSMFSMSPDSHKLGALQQDGIGSIGPGLVLDWSWMGHPMAPPKG